MVRVRVRSGLGGFGYVPVVFIEVCMFSSLQHTHYTS